MRRNNIIQLGSSDTDEEVERRVRRSKRIRNKEKTATKNNPCDLLCRSDDTQICEDKNFNNRNHNDVIRIGVSDTEEEDEKVEVIDSPLSSYDDVGVTEADRPGKKKKTVVLEGGLEITLDDDSDEEMEQCIRIIWIENVEVNRINLKPSDSVLQIFEFLSNKYNLPIEKVRVRNGDNIVSMYSPVQSLNLRVTSYLEAYELKDGNLDSCRDKGIGKKEIKCLLQALKKPLMLYLYDNQNMLCLLRECAKEIGTAIANLQLMFDGDKVEPSDTPASLGLEGGECVEVYVNAENMIKSS